MSSSCRILRRCDTLRWIKADAKEYFEAEKLRSLITKHSEYGASPIFLWTETTTQEPVEPIVDDVTADSDAEVKVEQEEKKEVEMRSVTKGEWVKVNDMAPLWMRYALSPVSYPRFSANLNHINREPKEVTDVEYEEFFKATYKETVAPTSWTHFKVCHSVFSDNHTETSTQKVVNRVTPDRLRFDH